MEPEGPQNSSSSRIDEADEPQRRAHRNAPRGSDPLGAFRELELARRALSTTFGYDDFLEGQEEALASAFAGRNLLVVMPTGSGKSLIYQLPSIVGGGLTVVVSPLISLMKDQVDELRRLGVRATAVNSSLAREEQRARMDGCAAGAYDILYIAPERCRDPSFVAMLERVDISRLAVDEAHCISEWGHDFRPDYRRLKAFRERVGRPPTSALTATATAIVQQDIIDSLGLEPEETDIHVHGFDRPNLLLSVVVAPNDEKKLEYLSRFLKENDGTGIIYAGTRKGTEDIAAGLRRIEPSIVAYHAGMEPEERDAAQEAFLEGRARVVAATSAFGMGIDKSDVRFVVHYNYPGSVEQYYQEIGRAGRDGLDSRCVLLYASADKSLREFFIDIGYPGRDQVESVWRALWSTKENPILLTRKEIAGLCDVRLSEGQVGTAIRMLDRAGVVRAFEGEPRITVTTDRPFDALKQDIRGPQQVALLEALASSHDLEEPGRFEVGLNALASDAGMSPDQARRALTALRDKGIAQYEAPFRGRGVEKLTDGPVPFGSIAIDWQHHEMMRGREEQKLRAMESYINQAGCRRGYILDYFGEKQVKPCGTCDNCVKRGGVSSAAGTIIEREASVAIPVLACVRSGRFAIGKNRTADVVTGSRNRQLLEWNLDRNPAYGMVDRTAAEVREVIDHMILEGYLELSGASGFPVLALTEAGMRASTAITREQMNELLERDKRGAAAARAERRAVNASGSGSSGSTGARRGRSGKDVGEFASADNVIVAAVIECIDQVPFPLGATKIAAVLTGTRAAWTAGTGIPELEAYGSVNATQERVRKLIQAMVSESLLAVSGSVDRPTLYVTEKGRAELGRSRD